MTRAVTEAAVTAMAMAMTTSSSMVAVPSMGTGQSGRSGRATVPRKLSAPASPSLPGAVHRTRRDPRNRRRPRQLVVSSRSHHRGQWSCDACERGTAANCPQSVRATSRLMQGRTPNITASTSCSGEQVPARDVALLAAKVTCPRLVSEFPPQGIVWVRDLRSGGRGPCSTSVVCDCPGRALRKGPDAPTSSTSGWSQWSSWSRRGGRVLTHQHAQPAAQLGLGLAGDGSHTAPHESRTSRS
jgi:hypothetical protein